MNKTIDFEHFYKQNYTAFFTFAYQILGDGNECQDVVSEAIEGAWKRMGTMTMAELRSYVFAAIRNLCIDRLRHEQARNKYVEFMLSASSEADDSDRVEALEEFSETFYRIIATMQPQTRKAFELCYIKKMKYAEAAELLGVTTSTIKKHIIRALKLFREELSKKSLK